MNKDVNKFCKRPCTSLIYMYIIFFLKNRLLYHAQKLFSTILIKIKPKQEYISEFMNFVSPVRHDLQNLMKFCKGLTEVCYFTIKKLMRIDIFFTRTTKPKQNFVNPDILG